MSELAFNRQDNVIQFGEIKKADVKYELSSELYEEFAKFLKSKNKVSKPKSEIIIQDGLKTVKENNKNAIKNADDIKTISDYFISNGKYRYNLYFTIGLNVGLRVSDLLTLRFDSFLNEDLSFKNEIMLVETKTQNTRTVRVNRHLFINKAVQQAFKLYFQYCDFTLDEYIFRTESNNSKSKGNIPMRRQSFDYILKQADRETGLNIGISTHSLRRSFGFWHYCNNSKSHESLIMLMHLFGHSSIHQTLKYIGISREDEEKAYHEVNLNFRNDI